MEQATRGWGLADERPRARILDLELDRVTVGAVMERIKGFIQQDTPHQIVTVNLQFVSVARKNREFAQLINQSDLVVADGMPLVWMSRLLPAPIPERITGQDLFSQCAALAAEKGYGVFLLGGAPGAAREAAAKLTTVYPGLRVTGTEHGRFPQRGPAENQEALVQALREFKPRFLFVGLGCPKQDFWIRDNMQHLGVPVCVGVGGTFDVFAGRLKRSPAWMQRCGVEWAFRLQQEPRRLWKRYLMQDLPTALRIFTSVFRSRFSPRASS